MKGFHRYGLIPTGVIFCTFFTIAATAFPEGYGGGSGTLEDPYQIWTPSQMNTIGAHSEDWNKSFKLMADIDLSGYTGLHYRRIGKDYTTTFTGTFDGNDRTIRNFTFQSPAITHFVGIFASIGNGATVKNLILENVNISTEGGSVGALVGHNVGGSIISCSSNGVINGGAFSVGGIVGANSATIMSCVSGCSVNNDDNYTGGVVGSNGGTIVLCSNIGTVNGLESVGGIVGRNTGVITACSNIGNINGEGKLVGGLVGNNDGLGSKRGFISDSFSDAIVEGSGVLIGGFVGDNSGTIVSCFSSGNTKGHDVGTGGFVGKNWFRGEIKNCYSSVSVIGQDTVGGFVGISYAAMSCCYSTGLVVGESHVGGLAGIGSEALSCFWDIDSSTLSYSACGKGLTAAQMKTASIFQNAGWGNQSWVMDDNIGLPRLKWENTQGQEIGLSLPIPLSGSGDPNDPYVISTAEEFSSVCWFTDILDKHIILAADLDLSEHPNTSLGDLGPFTGSFDGKGHRIKHGLIDRPNGYEIGLIETLGPGGQVRNVRLENIHVSGFYDVGGLVGLNLGIIEQCSCSGSIKSNSGGGGLVGWNKGTIRACSTFISVSGGDYVGGLVGGNNSGTITDCSNSGSVYGYSYVGGLAGYDTNGLIQSCFSSVAVRGEGDYIGGLYGRKFSSVCRNSFWDIQASGQPTSSGGIGKMTAEMKTITTFTNASWDFENTWSICEGTNYPRLQWQIPLSDQICPDGTGLEDLINLTTHWFTSNPADIGTADLNHDGRLDLSDFAILSQEWLKDTAP